MKRIVILLCIFFVALCGSIDVFAAETPSPVGIKRLYYSSGTTNYFFRVVSNGTGTLCANGPTVDSWAYINMSDDGAQEKIKALQIAYVMGKTVQLYTQGVLDPSGSTYCHILAFQIY